MPKLPNDYSNSFARIQKFWRILEKSEIITWSISSNSSKLRFYVPIYTSFYKHYLQRKLLNVKQKITLRPNHCMVLDFKFPKSGMHLAMYYSLNIINKSRQIVLAINVSFV